MLGITLIIDGESLEINLEHSLTSISKWESIHEKAFFGKEPMNSEQTVSYVQQMLVDKTPSRNWTDLLDEDHFRVITEYINSKQTATWFREVQSQQGSGEAITSELVYFWMISFQIPFECDKWHFNRLMTLIKICSIKQTKPKKMTRQAQAEEYRRLNAQRRQQLGTSG